MRAPGQWDRAPALRDRGELNILNISSTISLNFQRDPIVLCKDTRNKQPLVTMNRKKITPRAVLAVFAALALGAVPGVRAQTASKATTDTTSADASKADSEDAIVLSPFVVESTAETGGYIAKETLAGSRVRTDLKDVASAISVVTSQFLQNTSATNSQDLLTYTANTEVGGVRGNFSGAGGSATYDESAALLKPQNNTRVRGLEAADNTRDYFLTDIPWDSYNVDSVELQRGPNSILFGVGSPAGIVNTTLNAATFKNANKFENRLDQYGSIRNVIDLNRVIIPNVLSIRVEGLDDHTYFEQKPAYNHNRRLFGAVRYDPNIFGKDAHTSIRANYETGKIDSNQPRTLPPNDQITPWFLGGTFTIPGYGTYPNLNKLTLDPNTTWNQYGNANSPVIYPNGQYPWLLGSMGRQGTGIESVYNADGGAPLRTQVPTIIGTGGIDSNGNIKGTIDGFEFFHNWAPSPYSAYAAAVLPGGSYYSDKSLADPSIFDFYKKLIDGNNKHEFQDWKAGNISIDQTFLDDRLGVQFSDDYQSYNNGQETLLAGGGYALSIDMNTKLADGSANPNLGRPYVANSGQYGNNTDSVIRDSKRLTMFGDLRAEDLLGHTTLAKILGHHVFTGLFSQDTKRDDSRSFARWASSPDYTDATMQTGDITNGPRQIDWIAYLGPSLLNAPSAANANLSNITGDLTPPAFANTRYFNSKWSPQNNPSTGLPYAPADPYTYISHDQNGNEVTNNGTQSANPANYVGWTTQSFQTLNADKGDIDSLYTSGTKSRNVVRSRGFTWQGYFWDGVFVPVFGWRKDTVSNASSTAPKGSNNVSIMDYSVDTSAENTREVTGESKSWGGVLHTPKSLRAKLPANTDISLFYDRSQNFKADAPRGDIAGNMIPNPQGTTEEYGFAVSTLNDRVKLKVDWYTTKDSNATLPGEAGAGFGNNLYYAWALPYWGATHALAILDGLNNYRQGNWGWPWNGITGPDGTTTATPAQLRADAVDFFHNFPLSQQTADEYGLNLNVAAMHAATTDDQMYAAVPGYGLNSSGVYDIVNGAGASNLGLQPAYAGNLKSFGSGPVASSDMTSKGVEIELTTQVSKNWSMTVNATKTDAVITEISPTIDAWVASFTQFFGTVSNPTPAGLIKLWGGSTMAYNWNTTILSGYNVLKAQIGHSAPELAPYRVNFITNYNFDTGMLKGASAGLAYRWEDRRILGYQYDPSTTTLDISKPWHGPSDHHVDLWVGYQHRLTTKLDWRIQLNLRNVGEHDKLVPVSIEPDGTVGLSRIQEGMGAWLTNTFLF
jgi:outer membrane receptor protein involved in Fe transport